MTLERDEAALTALCNKDGDAVIRLVIDLRGEKDCTTALPLIVDTFPASRDRYACGVRQLLLRDPQPSTYRENFKPCLASSSILASSAPALKSRQTLTSLPTPPPILTKGSMTTAPL
jgi:hypothetical protein